MPQRPIQERDAVSVPGSALAIRLATPADIEPLATMINEAYRVSERGLFAKDRTSMEEIADAMKTGTLVLVAETSDGSLAGSLQLHLSGDEAHFALLAADTARQGNGMGRTLTADAEQRALAAGHTEMQIECIGEVGLRAYYERLGYRVHHVDEEALGSERSIAWGATRPWTMLHMRKRLA